MKIVLTKEEKENLKWILDMFVDTHFDGALYKKEIKVAKKISNKITIKN